MTYFDLLILTLAVGAVLDVWFNGSIFGEARAYLQCRVDFDGDLVEDFEPPSAAIEDIDDQGEPVEASFTMRVSDRFLPTLVCELLTCSFCLSHHIPWISMLLFFSPMLFGVESPALTFLLKLPVYSLAITRLSNLVNTYLPERARYER